MQTLLHMNTAKKHVSLHDLRLSAVTPACISLNFRNAVVSRKSTRMESVQMRKRMNLP